MAVSNLIWRPPTENREGVEFGTNVSITADSVEIGDRVLLRNDIRINCRGKLRIGHHSILGSDARLQCNNLIIGSWLYSCDGLEIGSGGCNSKESDVTIGDRVGIFERVLINPNHKVSIGDNCGIGREVQIWTHGAWLDPLAGSPQTSVRSQSEATYGFQRVCSATECSHR